MSYEKQFAILKYALDLPGFQSRQLPGGWVLNFQENLRVRVSVDGRFVLLGLAWQFLPERKTPMEEAELLCSRFPDEIPQEEILNMEETWCGRYVLLYRDQIVTDTCALFPVYYSTLGVSSDCTLLAEQMGMPRNNYQMPPKRVMNWMPGPRTQYDQIFRLLPSQIYRWETGKTEPGPLLATGYEGIPDQGERLERIIACFDASLRNLQAELPDEKLLVAITGGHDSRTLLALAKHAGVDFDAYTLLYDLIYEGDVTVPKELCKAAGITHHEIPRDKSLYSEAREQEYLDHISGMVYDEDRVYYACRQFDPLVKEFGNVAVLRSGVWPNVMEWYRRSFTPTGPGFDCYDWFGAEKGSLEETALQEYFAWNEKHPQRGLSACNVFYWEQRNGCWLSEIETGFDLMEHVTSLQPANCRYLMSMLMEFPEDERIMNYHQFRIVEQACPVMAKIPFGGKKRQNESAGRVLYDKMKRGIHRLRTLGIRKTLKTYASMLQTRKQEKQLQEKLKQ